MAEKKTTKTKSKSKSKSTNKKQSMIKLTFVPIAMHAKQYTMRLRDRKAEVINGNKVLVDTPLIEGLPIKLTVRQGEILEVTPEQCAELEKLGYVESKEAQKKREEFINGLGAQHPDKPDWHTLSREAEGSQFYQTLRDSEQKIYNDKLIRV